MRPPKPIKIRDPFAKKIRFASTMLGLCILIYLAVSYFIPTAASAIVMGFNIFINGVYSMNISTTAKYVIELVSYILSYTVPFILYAVIISIPKKVAFPTKAPKPSIALSAVFIGLGVSVIGSWLSQGIYAFMSMFGVYPISPDFSSPSEPVAAVINIVMLTVAAPIFEEFVFRGAIMQSLRRFGDVFALVVSSILFALFHGNLVQAPNAFVMGLAIGFFVIKTGSVWTGVLMHFANNLCSTVFSELSLSAPVAVQTMAYNILQVVYCILLVMGIAILTFKTDNFFSINFNQKNAPVISEGKKYAAFFTSPVMIVSAAIFVIFMIANTAVA